MSILKQMTGDVPTVNSQRSYMAFVHKYDLQAEPSLWSTITDEDWKDVRDFMVAIIKHGGDETLYYGEVILQQRKLIKWKEHTEIFDAIFESLVTYGLNAKAKGWSNFNYGTLMDRTIKLIQSFKLSGQFEEWYFKMVMAGLSSVDNHLIRGIHRFGEVIPWQKYPDKIKLVAERTYEMMKKHPEMPLRCDWSSATSAFWTTMLKAFSGNDAMSVQTAKDVVQPVNKVFLFSAEEEWIDPNDMDLKTFNYDTCQNIMSYYYIHHIDMMEVIRPAFPTLLKLRDCGDEGITKYTDYIISALGENINSLMGNDLSGPGTNFEPILEFLKNPDTDKGYFLYNMYRGGSEPFRKHINDIVKVTHDNVGVSKPGMLIIIELAKEYPQDFSKESIKLLVNTLSKPQTLCYGFACLAPLSTTREKDILPHDDAIIAAIKPNDPMTMHATTILVQLANLGKKYAVKYSRVLVKIARKSEPLFILNVLQTLKLIGMEFREAVVEHKQYIEGLLDNPQTKEAAQQVLDVLEGRSLKTISHEMKIQKKDIKEIDTRVTVTEHRVDDIENDVSELSTDMTQLKEDVAEHDHRLGELTEVVEETVEKVEEIDKKTLSHAPVWSRDVAKIMNPKAEYDWRFLATKLGYSNNDIRNWATQPDPCLSLLDEWFATHKTRDATFAVEQALSDMNRIDAAMIVENALKQTEGLVEDVDDEAWDPPSIFISYQWSHQSHVRLLHKHLEMAGYKSWMDIGQMGGGDKLFAKIDQGIRAAKVIICCVSEKYAQSPNCNREVNLAVTLGKPMIPLLMEKLSWPPPGSMGPIFGEYIFVRFFARLGETAGDDRYWPTAKFQELLMQLRYTLAPDADSITSDLYKDWWSPPEEFIAIKPSQAAESVVTSSTNVTDEHASSPDVFISYQWGKQPQIKKLYQILTKKGYTCWLDIMQMGGGDSLYEKIDKGVRGCKVVLSCVTSKYALSANCRREVSLADALKKPIVPLLLESITWPPAGPMSMVFTQLLYIDFCKIDIQNEWQGQKMNELYDKLYTYVPCIQLEPHSDDFPKSSEISKAITNPVPKGTSEINTGLRRPKRNVEPQRVNESVITHRSKNGSEQMIQSTDNQKRSTANSSESAANNMKENSNNASTKSSSCALL